MFTLLDDAEKAGIEKAMGAAIDRAKAARDRLSNPDDLTERAFKVVFGESWSQKGLQDQINFAKSEYKQSRGWGCGLFFFFLFYLPRVV